MLKCFHPHPYACLVRPLVLARTPPGLVAAAVAAVAAALLSPVDEVRRPPTDARTCNAMQSSSTD